ncbi:MAG: FAD-binding oxidoreductase [Microthrixaceae bacterium]
MRVDPWKLATVLGIRPETPRASTIRLQVPGATRHLPGQHYVVRLTAPDGYVAQRSYSVASAPDDSGEIELTVERLDDGEVSTYLHGGLEVGDRIEVRGPIGGWFVWTGDHPAVLVGGGSGVVPLMSMVRFARATGRSDLVRLIVSVRTPGDLLYADELPGPETTIVHTRSVPPGSERAAGRLSGEDLAMILPAPLDADTTVYLCGSGGFADAASALLLGLGVPVDRIRVERFGPTG